jgi:hypothetical protein
VVRAALGDSTRALAALAAARKLDPAVDERPEVQGIAAKLAK